LRVTALCLALTLSLSGCWSYRGLNEFSIVIGMGVDINPANGNYMISAEIVDFSKSVKDSAPGAKLIEAEGRTMFEAIRDAKRRLNNRLYFANMQVMVFGEEMARTKGVGDAADWILRDAEVRETMYLVIAKGVTAREFLRIKGADQAIVSMEIADIIAEDNKSTSSTVSTQLYSAFDILNCPCVELTLPAFRIVDNNGEQVAEADGIALFNNDRLISFLTPDESKYFLMATGESHGGILALASSGTGAPDTSLEIADGSAKTSFTNEGGQIRMKIETETKVYLAETMEDIDVLDEDQIKALENEAEKRMALEITAVIQKVQTQMGTDIFGFGNVIHKRDVNLWKSIQDSWSDLFRTLPVDVTCKVTIVNTAFIKSKEAVKK
jgi:spore germination protein KC